VKILCDIRSQRAPVWLEGVYTGRMQFADPAITGLICGFKASASLSGFRRLIRYREAVL
jgi:hypothetical protein